MPPVSAGRAGGKVKDAHAESWRHVEFPSFLAETIV